jgi:hypothetical protein
MFIFFSPDARLAGPAARHGMVGQSRLGLPIPATMAYNGTIDMVIAEGG